MILSPFAGIATHALATFIALEEIQRQSVQFALCMQAVQYTHLAQARQNELSLQPVQSSQLQHPTQSRHSLQPVQPVQSVQSKQSLQSISVTIESIAACSLPHVSIDARFPFSSWTQVVMVNLHLHR